MDNLVLARLLPDERKIFDDVDSIISRAITIGDPMLAFEHGMNLHRNQSMRGLALAKLLYKLRESWGLFEAAGIDDDLLIMADVHMNVRPSTSKKYIEMWERVFENEAVPDGIKAVLSGRAIGDLLLLTAAVGEGTLTGDSLLSAALSPDRESLRDQIKKARGEKTSSSSAIRICLNVNDSSSMSAGTIYAKRGDERVTIGMLLTPTTELGEQARIRLINAVHMIEIL